MKRKILNGLENGNKLSIREAEVLKLLFTGKTYKEVGVELFISPETVRNHAHKIYMKLKVKNKVTIYIAHLTV